MAGNKYGAIIVGAILILLGLASVGAGIALSTIYKEVSTSLLRYTYSPTWAGVLYILAGIVGTSTCCCFGSQDGTKCTLIVFIAISVIALLAAGVQVITEAFWATAWIYPTDCDKLYNNQGSGCVIFGLDIHVIHLTTAAIGGGAGLAALIGIIMACCGFSSGDTSDGNHTMTYYEKPGRGEYPGEYGSQQPQEEYPYTDGEGAYL
ncbi:uncharacterized protein [Amphiura filiformis]|uniref:uncharacterized protein n=1 Tax=Amphiura filiformis TaxID=82378 RepID=UPI003B21D59D